MADKSVFSRLKRLFSTDVIIRNVGGNQVKVIDSGKIQSTGELQTNSLVDRYNRIYSTSPSSLYGAQFNLNYQYLRTQLYSEYDVMDQDAIIASALDIISDESTLKNDMGEVLQIRSSSEDIQKILYNLFYDVLNIEFNLWMWIRQMCKYGDFFLKLEIAEKFDIQAVEIAQRTYSLPELQCGEQKDMGCVDLYKMEYFAKMFEQDESKYIEYASILGQSLIKIHIIYPEPISPYEITLYNKSIPNVTAPRTLMPILVYNATMGETKGYMFGFMDIRTYQTT